jgi:RimJ/RimL family protein N-acetyltransferase
MNPLLIELPEQLITERLIIRPPRVGDGAHVNDAIRESIDEIRPWMPWAKETPSVEQTEENIRRSVARFITREDLRLQIHLRDGTFVGSSGLHRMDWNVPKFEIGYWCRTSLAGRGYITEAVDAIQRFAFESLKANRVEIHMDERNVRSRGIPERLKFPLEGILRNFERANDGTLRDSRIYAKTAIGS